MPRTRTSEPTAKNAYHHGDLRSALIQAGVELLEQEDTDALTLRAVAARAGVSHAAPYRHFADKQALLAAIAQQGFDVLGQQLSDVSVAQGVTAAQRLKAALLQYLAFGRTHPHHAQLMFGVLAREDHAELKQAAQGAFGLLVALVADALAEAGGKARPDPRQIALSCWAQAHGLLLLSRHVDFSELVQAPSSDAATHDAIDLFLRAVLVKGPPKA